VHWHQHLQPETPASVSFPTIAEPWLSTRTAQRLPWSIVCTRRSVPGRATASKELTFTNNAPYELPLVVGEIDAARFDPALAGLACERLYQPIIGQEKLL